jgi:replicative DNA helicase
MSENPKAKLEKTLPHSEEAEKYVLGQVILDSSTVWQVVEKLEADDFYIPANKIICRAIFELVEDGADVNHVTIFEQLKNTDQLEKIGNGKDLSEILVSLSKGLPKSSDLRNYVETIEKYSTVRKKIHLNELISSALQVGDLVAAEEAEAQLYDISNKKYGEGMAHVGDASTSVLRRSYMNGKSGNMVTGVQTGIFKFDEMTAGLQPTDLIIVAARPSVGKTALCMSMAQFAALENQSNIAVFSLEMSREQLVMRMLASEARVSLQKIRTGLLSANEWARLIYAKELISKAPIYVNDSARLTPMRLKSNAKKLIMMKGKLDLILVDYLQLMSGSQRAENRQQETAQISRELKMIAKELGVPVVALSQLSRAPESRGSRKPQLSDLRDSGAIEQDADVVAFIYREEMNEKTDENEGQAELIIAKQRNGPTGTIPLAFISEYTRFENLFAV